MKTAFCLLMLIGVLSCKKAEVDTVEPEYRDWYTLRSPIDREVQSVWGDWDKTLLLTTSFAIFRSTDKGKNWQQVYQQSNGMWVLFRIKTPFLSWVECIISRRRIYYQQVLIHADYYSLDDGQTWQRYLKRNPLLDEPRPGQPIDKRLPGKSGDRINRHYI